jgi:predicted dehydrogenase/nucleoside-diphosphate-sugar epimerase
MSSSGTQNGRPDAATPVRVAIIGAGSMARHHARAAARSGVPARVVAVADPSPEARAAMQEAAPEAEMFESHEALLAATRVDVVHVCTPPETHEAVAEAALRAGCNVYVEKPFVETPEAAERLLALAAERGLRMCAGHQLLFEAPARHALDLLPALGSLAHVESYFSFRPARGGDGRTPIRDDLQLIDILPHPVYLLLRVLEEAVPHGRVELQDVQVGPAGTVHALVRRGTLTGVLTVTLEGRPIESYLRMVGTNGTVHADFVRGTVQRQIGPGASGIDKLLNPYRIARQLAVGTTAALGARALKRQRSYPGLAEIFEAFYAAVRSGAPAPVSDANILDTVRICEQVARTLAMPRPRRAAARSAGDAAGPAVAVTGGTGFLGREIVDLLATRGRAVRVLARREPPEWDRLPGAEYRAVDLARPLEADVLAGVGTVIHCAAATSGGWEAHQAQSLDATENLLRACAAAGVRRVIHVSSISVVEAEAPSRPIAEHTPLLRDPRGSGPYAWGKLESERLAARLAEELGLELRIVRPGAIIDDRAFDPPGRLGRRIGNLFVAVGSPRDTLGVVDVRSAARILVWMADHFDDAPPLLNLIEPEQPTKRSLLRRLRRSNPDLRVLWLPRPALIPLSWAALGAQKVLRPGKPAIDVAGVFAPERYDTALAARLDQRARNEGGTPAPDSVPVE